MKFVFTEKKFHASDDLKAFAEKKIGKLDRYFKSEAEVFVMFGQERGRDKLEVTVKSEGMIYRFSELTGDMYTAVNTAIATIDRQIRKNRTRLEKRLRTGAFDKDAAPEVEEEEEFEIIRTKRFSLKPMTPEEAILQMNLLNHEFFAFRNENDNSSFSVVYRRKNGGYGLIENDG